jgi:hypothetical protein
MKIKTKDAIGQISPITIYVFRQSIPLSRVVTRLKRNIYIESVNCFIGDT